VISNVNHGHVYTLFDERLVLDVDPIDGDDEHYMMFLRCMACGLTRFIITSDGNLNQWRSSTRLVPDSRYGPAHLVPHAIDTRTDATWADLHATGQRIVPVQYWHQVRQPGCHCPAWCDDQRRQEQFDNEDHDDDWRPDPHDPADWWKS